MRGKNPISRAIIAYLLIAGSVSADTITNPDDDFVRILHNQLSKTIPDFTIEAQKTIEYRSADEFSRSEVLQQQINMLKLKYDDATKYDKMVINVRTSLGEWDSSQSGFLIQLWSV